MFGNRAMQVTFVKTKESSVKNKPQPEDVVTVDPKQIAEIATDYTVKAIGAVGVAIGGYKVLSTICEIAVIAAKAKYK